MQLSLLSQLAAATPLQKTLYFGQLPPDLRDRAIAACGVGCDHAIGERLAAVVDFTGKEGYFLGGVITDRAFAWRMPARGSVRWADVGALQVKTGLLHEHVTMQMVDGSVVAAPDITEITPLIQQITRYAPADRATISCSSWSSASTRAARSTSRPRAISPAASACSTARSTSVAAVTRARG
jgi:hypothetical protein